MHKLHVSLVMLASYPGPSRYEATICIPQESCEFTVTFAMVLDSHHYGVEALEKGAE